MAIKPVVLLGETMGLFHSAQGPLERNRPVSAGFGGAESNVAIGLSRLGKPARWISALGDDPFGWMILKTLRGEGIDVSHVQMDATHPTGLMMKVARPGNEPAVHYYRRGSAFSHVSPDSFDPACWRDASVIYLSGITPALSDGCAALIRHVIADARQLGIPIWFDPNYRRKLWSEEAARQAMIPLLADVDTLLVGLSEATLLVGETDAPLAARALLQLGPRRVIVKQGSRGASYFDHAATHTVAAHEVSVVDPIGAGDAFGAGFLAAHLDGRPPAECLNCACALGAMACLGPGDWESLPTLAELDDFLARRFDAAR